MAEQAGTALARSSRCWLALLICSAALVWLAPLHAAVIQVTDDRGQVVSFKAAPQRVVSLLPSLTETVCALGQCQRLVGVDRYSNWPANVAALPRMGGGLDTQLEAVVAARPDVVLLAGSARLADRLESLGIKTVALEPKNHSDVQRALRVISQMFGLPDAIAIAVWRQMDAGVQTAARTVPPQALGARVYVEVSSVPHGAGPTSFMGETLARLGVQNILPASLGPFPALNPEFVVRAGPELIMLSHAGADISERPGWGGVPAVRSQRICRFTGAEADVLVRPGPRMDVAARLMAQCLSEKFKGPR